MGRRADSILGCGLGLIAAVLEHVGSRGSGLGYVAAPTLAGLDSAHRPNGKFWIDFDYNLLPWEHAVMRNYE